MNRILKALRLDNRILKALRLDNRILKALRLDNRILKALILDMNVKWMSPSDVLLCERYMLMPEAVEHPA